MPSDTELAIEPAVIAAEARRSLGEEERCELTAFNLENKHVRDEHIHFYPEKHVYTFDAQPLISVSSLIAKLFPEFDSAKAAARKATPDCPKEKIMEEWNKQGQEARDAGTFMHRQIELALLGQPVETAFHFAYQGKYVRDEKRVDISRELHMFEQFRAERRLASYRTEWRIYDEVHGIAGTIDYLTKDAEGVYRMFDWKRTGKMGYEGSQGFSVTKFNKFGRHAFPPIAHLDDTVYTHYCLQQNLYRYILKEHYGIGLAEMFLVVLYPSNSSYHLVEIPVMEEEARRLLDYARNLQAADDMKKA